MKKLLCMIICLMFLLHHSVSYAELSYELHDIYTDGNDFLGYLSFSYQGYEFELNVSKTENGQKLVSAGCWISGSEDAYGYFEPVIELLEKGVVYINNDSNKATRGTYVNDDPAVLKMMIDSNLDGTLDLQVQYNANTCELSGGEIPSIEKLAYIDWESKDPAFPPDYDSNDYWEISSLRPTNVSYKSLNGLELRKHRKDHIGEYVKMIGLNIMDWTIGTENGYEKSANSKYLAMTEDGYDLYLLCTVYDIADSYIIVNIENYKSFMGLKGYSKKNRDLLNVIDLVGAVSFEGQVEETVFSWGNISGIPSVKITGNITWFWKSVNEIDPKVLKELGF